MSWNRIVGRNNSRKETKEGKRDVFESVVLVLLESSGFLVVT